MSQESRKCSGQADGPLDLRFDQTQGITAWDFLMSAPREEPWVFCAALLSKVLNFSTVVDRLVTATHCLGNLLLSWLLHTSVSGELNGWSDGPEHCKLAMCWHSVFFGT